jgi:choice-of-anchor B domain-containing protein
LYVFQSKKLNFKYSIINLHIMKKVYLFFVFVMSLSVLSQTADKNVTFKSIKSYTGPGSNICGYVDSLGNEYALFGWTGGVDIVKVTNPTNPVSVFNIPGASSIWREIKVNGKYAYITTEAGGGLKIAYLGNLPSSNVPIVDWTPTINGNVLGNIHALHIDNNKVYLYGANVVAGAPIVADISGANAANPSLIGVFTNTQPGSGNNAYVHDGYVRNDTLYSCHIYSGYVNIVKFNNIGDSVNYLATPTTTPTAFPHNTWLNQSGKNLFTTDENQASYLACYDISNLSNVSEADRIQSQNPNSNSVVHNTHVLKNSVGEFAVTSWYRDGIVITDVTRPSNLVNVGWFDTFTAAGGGGFDGCWGVYPFLPSGNLVTSGRDSKLHVLTPTYKRACYYEGVVIDSVTNLPISAADVLMPLKNVKSNLMGKFKTGTVDSGLIAISIQKSGYVTKTRNKNMLRGIVATDTVKLVPVSIGIPAESLTSNFSVYPNPAINTLSIENQFTNAHQYEYLVFDIAGKQVLSGYITNNIENVNVMDLKPGFYTIKVLKDKVAIGNKKWTK